MTTAMEKIDTVYDPNFVRFEASSASPRAGRDGWLDQLDGAAMPAGAVVSFMASVVVDVPNTPSA